MDSSSEPSEALMRKGTHSCVECRQRKVRCITDPHAPKCRGCTSKQLRCTVQSIKSRESLSIRRTGETPNHARKAVGAVQHAPSNSSRATPDKNIREFDRISGSRSGGLRTSNSNDDDSRKRRKLYDATSKYLQTGSRSRASRVDPLMDLSRDINMASSDTNQPRGNTFFGQSGDVEAGHQIIAEMRTKIPNSAPLTNILQAGHHASAMWIKAFPETLKASTDDSTDKLVNHVYRCLHSDSRIDAVKIMLCLALHIQQLPHDLHIHNLGPSASLIDLQDDLMTSAENLLTLDNRCGLTLEGIECMITQSDFHINAGSLHMVWLIIRRAIDHAQLLGYHRQTTTDSNPTLSARRRALWMELWQRERGFSLILGLPYSISDAQIPVAAKLSDDASDHDRMPIFLQDLGLVMGCIIDRDQGSDDQKPYSVTLRIEERLEECEKIMSPDWWNFQPTSDIAQDGVAEMFVAKMRFFTVQRLLHLPYLLKSSNDRKYEGSRSAVLQSSRQIIHVYTVLRNEERPIIRMCDMVDFQAFAAAMTIMIDLLANSESPSQAHLDREDRDWNLISHTAEVLGRIARSMQGCGVAAQGAQVLNDFARLRNSPADEDIHIDIPYFGRIEMQRHHERTPSAASPNHLENQTSAPVLTDSVSGSANTTVSPESYFFPSSTASQEWQFEDDTFSSMLDSSLADDWNWLVGSEGAPIEHNVDEQA